MLAIIALLLGVSSSSSSSSDGSNGKTSINAQVFCDNWCSVYFNGELVFDDTSRRRTVDTFSIDKVSKTGTRTFGVILKDNPYSTLEGIWQYESPTFLAGQTDADGNPIIRQYCLGDGGFRAIFTDSKCGNEVVVSNDQWKCETIASGPRDIEACFPNWSTDSTDQGSIEASITKGGDGDKFDLYDPCIRSSDASFAPDLDNCDCAQDYNPNYVDFADKWYLPGFDDSSWVPATEYPESDALPKQGRAASQTLDECTIGDATQSAYCDTTNFPLSSWGSSEFIWSDAIELDNVVLCRYEYESTC